MKREDFKIEGIPEGYRVYDVDLTPSGRPIAVLGHRIDESRPAFARMRTLEVRLPDRSLWFNDYHKTLLLSSFVRAAGEARLIVVAPHQKGERWLWQVQIWDDSGLPASAFNVGEHAGEEILASGDWVLVFYSDEGLFSGDALSQQGLSVFSPDGIFLWGHGEQFGSEGGLNCFFHAAAWINSEEAAVFAQVAWKSVFIRLNVRQRRQQIWHPPAPIAAPGAVTVQGDHVIVYGVGTTGDEDWMDPQDPWVQEMMTSGLRRHHIVAWVPGATTWDVLGEWHKERYERLRGLPGGRFIAVQPDGYTILSFD